MFKKVKKKIKKFFSPLFKPRRLIIFGFLFLIILGLILPQRALAVWYNPLSWGLVGGLFKAILRGVASMLIWFTGLFAKLSAAILSGVLGPGVTDVSITRHPTVQIGWPVVRDFTNMLIVLGFVVIGIATTLRYKEYAAKQVLPKLIIVALLVNFSTLFCGLAIDAANITMDYFLSAGGAGGIITPILEGPEIAKDALEKEKEDDGFFIKALLLAAFNIIAAIVFSALALLFLARFVFLIMLVILSPLAFFCYVFKLTKEYWNLWWNQFFKWCLVGVTGSFFIFLAGKMLEGGILIGQDPEKTITNMSFLIPCAFLLIGIKIVLATSAMGASAILGIGGTAAGAGGAAAARIGWGGAKAGAKAGAKGVRAGAKGIVKGAPIAAKAIGKGVRHPIETAKAVWKGAKAAPGVAWKGAKAAPGVAWKGAKKAAPVAGRAVMETLIGAKVMSKKEKRRAKLYNDVIKELEAKVEEGTASAKDKADLANTEEKKKNLGKWKDGVLTAAAKEAWKQAKGGKIPKPKP